MFTHTHYGDGAASRARVKRAGVVAVLALLFLTLFVAMGFAFMNTTTLGLKQSENFHSVADARFAAESGTEFMLYHLREVRMPHDTSDSTFLANLQVALGQRLNGTANLAGGSVQVTTDSVVVPEVSLDGERTFRAWVTWLGADQCELIVRGLAAGVSRYVTIRLKLTPKTPRVFDYGLASRGQIVIGGSTRIVGVNYPEEANVFSATTAHDEAITIDSDGSSVEVSGDLFVTGGESYVTIMGTPSIGGGTTLEEISQHVHYDCAAPDFPEIDTSPLSVLATNVVNASTDTSVPNAVYKNIRIAAGTNPTFNADVTLNGVVYIEAPNKVKFSGHAAVNAVIVTDRTDHPLDACQITFTGTVDAQSVAMLPDTPDFADIRDQTGSFIVAPGFGVTFSGDFNTISGSIAADQVTFSGNSGGTIKGTVMGLSDLPMSVEGSVDILVDRMSTDDDPAGFLRPRGVDPIPDSYRELVVVPQ